MKNELTYMYPSKEHGDNTSCMLCIYRVFFVAELLTEDLRMLRRAVFLAGLALAGNISLLAAIPAWALEDGGRHTNAANVYDSRGVLIGELGGKDANGFGLAVGLVGDLQSGTPPSLHFIPLAYFGFPGNGGFPNPFVIYYSLANCTGVAFLPYDPYAEILPTAEFDGQSLWGVHPAQFGHYVLASKADANGCTNGPFILWSAPAVRNRVSFTPPFTVRP